MKNLHKFTKISWFYSQNVQNPKKMIFDYYWVWGYYQFEITEKFTIEVVGLDFLFQVIYT
jgi:hypothetical protein